MIIRRPVPVRQGRGLRCRRLAFESLEDRRMLAVIGNNYDVGDTLRHYRIAIAATAEYTDFWQGQAAAYASIQQFVADLNAIFEPELAIHLDLVSGTNVVYSGNVNSDPYSNGNVSAMLTQNQSTLDAQVGAANYDIGHVFGTQSSGGSGIASLGVVGYDGWKGRGVSTSSNPVGLSWLGLAAHEIGHQFGAEHTFNSAVSNCIGNRSGGNAYEPASGSTLMSYAGICSSDNLQSSEDFVFHSASFEQIEDLIGPAGPSAANPHTTTNNNNAIPQVQGGSNHTIPIGTPFELQAVGSDADAGDTLTYSWEQLDLGPAMSLPLTDNGSSPLFRAFLPRESPSRVFPSLAGLLDSAASSSGEALPTQDRTLNFRVTVRDGRGGVNSDDVRLTVEDGGGPFVVTSQNAATNWTGGSTQSVTWNVAGVDAAPFNYQEVDILLSTDGGLSYPHLLDRTANDGAHDVVAPNLNAAQSRLRIQPVGAIFFDLNDADFSISAVNNPPTISDIADQTIDEGAATGALAFTVGDVETAASSLTVTGSSSNPTLVPAGNIVFGGSGGSRTVTVTPAPDQFGESTITITVDDGAGGTASDTFNVTVRNSDNLPPTIVAIVGPDFQAPGRVGSPAAVSGVFDDADAADVHVVTIDWGDGEIETLAAGLVDQANNAFAATHGYSEGGIYLATVTVSDGQAAAAQGATIAITGVRVAAGQLQIVGSNQRDLVTVSPNRSGGLRVRSQWDGQPQQTQVFAAGQVQGIVADMGAGDDLLAIHSRVVVPVEARGGPGDDRLQTGGGADRVEDLEGDNSIRVGEGADVVVAGAGDDWIWSGEGADVVNGGGGADRIDAGGGADVIRGGAGNDALVGGAGDDLLVGESGEDTLDGGLGGDLLIGGLAAHGDIDAALTAILSVWSSGAGYEERLSQIRGGGGPLGGVALVAGATVLGDGQSDQLSGGAGRDWFFANLEDLTIDLESNEELDLP